MPGPASKKSASSKKVEAGKFNVGDTVLCKMRGFPAWPGKIVGDDSIGNDVRREKPAKGQFWCIRFFPKGDHSWAHARDLTHLTPSAIKEYVSSSHKKAGELLEGYKIAGDPTDWETEQADIARQTKESNEGVDELDEDEDEEPSSSGKRKKAANGDGKKAKKAKVEKKPKAESTPKAKATKKNGKVKSNPTLESEDEAEAEKPKESASSKKAAPESSADADAQKVKDWRHKLQRGFLGKAPPAEKDMAQCHEYFNAVEAYDSMTIEQLQTSKIGKVMRKIAALDNIPNEAEYNFKERASKLMTKWQTQLPSGSTADETTTPTNGNKKSGPESSKSKSDDKPKSTASKPASSSKSVPAAEDAEAAPAEDKKDGEDVPMEDEATPAGEDAVSAAEEKKEDATKEDEPAPAVEDKVEEEKTEEAAPAESS